MSPVAFQWIQIFLGGGIFIAAIKIAFSMGSMNTEVKQHGKQIPIIFETTNAINTKVTRMDSKLDSVVVRANEHTKECDADRKETREDVIKIKSSLGMG